MAKGYDVVCLHYTAIVRFLLRAFEDGPVQKCRETMQRLEGHRAVFTAYKEIIGISYGVSAVSLRTHLKILNHRKAATRSLCGRLEVAAQSLHRQRGIL